MRSGGARAGAAGGLAVQVQRSFPSPLSPRGRRLASPSPPTLHARTRTHTQLMAETSAHTPFPGGDRLHFAMSVLSTISTYVEVLPVLVLWKINFWKEKSIFISSAFNFQENPVSNESVGDALEAQPVCPSLKA